MRKIITGLCIILVLSGATLAYGESVDTKWFGRCSVLTEIDDFTDQKLPQLVCHGEGSSREKYRVGVTCSRKEGFSAQLYAGIQFHIADAIDVLYRFDKRELVTESWRYYKSHAVNFDAAIHRRFVEGIEKARKLIFKVGEEAGSVELTGSEGAVTEYKKRCSALGRPIK